MLDHLSIPYCLEEKAPLNQVVSTITPIQCEHKEDPGKPGISEFFHDSFDMYLISYHSGMWHKVIL